MDSSAVGTRRRPRHRRLVVVIVLALLAAWGLATARLFVWPSLPDLPEQADAIVELGGPGDRDSVALDLARQHRARYLVQSTTAKDAARGQCLPAVEGVTVLCFHADPATTRGEAWAIADLAQRYGWRSVILVTTPDQAWRAMVRVGRCFDGEISVATARLPARLWLVQIPYQWGATVKAFTVERSC